MLTKDSLQFLKEVKKNNNRDWFNANKHRYLEAKEVVENFIASLIKEFSKLDNELVEVDAKKCLMRIYRDVRFSKDKNPYKTNYGIWISKLGRNGNYPGYYLHIEPGASFIAAGYWMPEPAHLKMIREEIDYNLSEFQAILKKASFKKIYEGLDDDYRLTTVPKGYTKDNPALEYLQQKSFTVTYPIKDQAFLEANSVKQIVSIWKEAIPFNRFLQRAIQLIEE